MARIKKHIPKAKLPFYSPCEVKCRLQNGMSTTPHAHTDPKKLVRSSHWSTHAELSHSILSLMVVWSPSSTHSSFSAKRRPRVSFPSPVDYSSVRRHLFMGLTILHLRSTHLTSPHLTSDPHTSDRTSPSIYTPPTSPHLWSTQVRSTSPQTQICQNPPSNP